MNIRRTAGAAAVFVVLATAHVARPAPAYAFETGAEAEFVSLINAVRAGAGVAPLTVDPELTRVARDWATTMSEGTGLAHNPNLRGIIDSITSMWRKLGENVAYGGSVAAIHQGLVGSPHHYENLISPDFRVIGVGAVLKGRTLWVTQDFLSGAAQSAAPPVTAAPKPKPTTTTVPRVRTVARPAAPAPPKAPVVQAPPPPPPPPPQVPLRLRVALETEQLMERSLRSLAAAKAQTRAR